jgi:hypothetical protein
MIAGMRRGTDALLRAKDRFGRLPATPLWIGALVLIVVAAAIDRRAAEPVGAVVLVALAAYALSRPERRGDVICAFILPSAGSAIPADLFGISRALIGWPLAVVTLVILIGIDVGDREAAAGTAAGGPPATPAP